MMDVPVFVTESGIATILLDRVPFTKIAYVILRDISDPSVFVEECVEFCIAAGAEKVIASGHDTLKRFPCDTSVLIMDRDRADFPKSSAKAVRLPEKHIPQFCELYNMHMLHVPNAAYLSESEITMLWRDVCYFVYERKQLIGLGIATDYMVDAVISLYPGKGESVMAALVEQLNSCRVRVAVAAQNVAACKLYQRLGFTVIGEKEKWYRIF